MDGRRKFVEAAAELIESHTFRGLCDALALCLGQGGSTYADYLWAKDCAQELCGERWNGCDYSIALEDPRKSDPDIAALNRLMLLAMLLEECK